MKGPGKVCDNNRGKWGKGTTVQTKCHSPRHARWGGEIFIFWGKKNQAHSHREQIGHCQRGEWGAKWVKQVKRYKVPMIKLASPGGVR